MKSWKYIYTAVLLSFIAFSCANPVYVEKADDISLSDYKTYMWVNTRTHDNRDGERATAYADISVHNAVNAELKKEGWKEVESNPDVLLMYDILVENTSVKETDPVYSRPFTRYFYNPYRGRWVALYYPSRFLGYQAYETPVKEGTVTITMADADTDKTIWQGWTTEEMDYNRITSGEVTRSVRNIFNKFDVAMR